MGHFLLLPLHILKYQQAILQLKADGSIKCVQAVKCNTSLWRLNDSQSHMSCRWKTRISHQCSGCVRLVRFEGVTWCRDDVMSLLPQTARADGRRVLSFKHLYWHLKWLHTKWSSAAALRETVDFKHNVMFDRYREWEASQTGLFSNASQKMLNAGVILYFCNFQ